MNEFHAGRTQTSNEAALLQAVSAGDRRVISIVQGAGYRYVEERIERVPASAGLDAYEHWAETHRSGLYETLEAARRGAEAETAGPHEWRAYGYT